MIAAKDAVAAARALIGTPYAQLDCINLIKKIIRTAPGGVKSYTTAGTNSLWRSAQMSEKYRDLTACAPGIDGACAGMLAFKRSGEDVHHVGLVTGEGTVIHSSSEEGGRGVVETPLTIREGWNAMAVHRAIRPDGDVPQPEEDEQAFLALAHEIAMDYPAAMPGRVFTNGGKLNVRSEPYGEVIGTLAPGSEVEILGEEGEWLRVHFGESGSGYVFAAYIRPSSPRQLRLRIVDEAGDVYDMEGAITINVIEE